MSSRRRPPTFRLLPYRAPDDAAPRLELRPEAWDGGWHSLPLPLEDGDLAELRRSIRVVRRLLAGGLPLVKGTDAANDAGMPVDPLDDDASRFGVNGAFLRAGRPTPPLFVAWMRLCHEAAGDLLGDPESDLYDYADDPLTDRERLLELLDEVEARLDLLQGRS